MSSDEGGEGEGPDHPTLFVLIVALFGALCGVFLRFAQTQLLPQLRERVWSGLGLPPSSLSILLLGVLTSALRDVLVPWARAASEASGHPPLIAEAIESAQLVDPQVILLVLLPPLIYESASSMSWHVFSRVSGQAFLLAFPGVIVQVYAIAAFFRYAMAYGSPEDGGLWNWDVALTFGSIVSATDPVAVVAALHSLGAPAKLANMIDGEALLNDGSAFVMFLIFVENVRRASADEPPIDAGWGVGMFFRLSAGGFALGALAYGVVSTWLALIENDWRTEAGIVVIAIYVTFSSAEATFHVSGVLAVVTLGLLMGRQGKYTLSPAATNALEAVMRMVSFIAETLIFYVAGIAAWTALTSHLSEVRTVDALVLYAVLQAARAAVVALFFPVLRQMGYKVSAREGVILVYAGLRGAVSLSLSLLVLGNRAFDPTDAARIHFLTASATVLTMLLNGSTTPIVYSALKLYPANHYRDVIVRRAMGKLERKTMPDRWAALMRDCLYSRADLQIVRTLVPYFSRGEGIGVLQNNLMRIPYESTYTDIWSEQLVRRIASLRPRSAHRPRADADDDKKDPRRMFRALHASTTHALPPGAEPRPVALAPAAAPALLAKSGAKALRRAVGKVDDSKPDDGKAHARFRASDIRSYAVFEKDDGIVETLFAVVASSYEQQYESKQLAGTPLAALIEALTAGAEYLDGAPLAPITAAFELELDVLLYLLPTTTRWRQAVDQLPLVGRPISDYLEFNRCFDLVEALAGYIRAHEELAHVVADDPDRLAVYEAAVMPVVARARRALDEQHSASTSRWVITSFQINVLAARAAVLMKREAVHELQHEGTLTHADLEQLGLVFDRAHHVLDSVRVSLFGAHRFHAVMRRVMRNAPVPGAEVEMSTVEGGSAAGL